jgi:hypothetical protein
MTVGQRASDQESGGGIGKGFAFEDAAERFDLSLGPIGEIGESAFADCGALAGGFAQEDGGRRVAIGDALHVHGFMVSLIMMMVNASIINYMGT